LIPAKADSIFVIQDTPIYHSEADRDIFYNSQSDMANPKYAASDRPVPVSELVDTLSDGTKVKRRFPRMRACNEKDEKGKLCAGHLKRWYFFGDEVKKKFGADAEIYRCEHCKTLYLPSPEESPRTGTLSW
jgi:hypothetical protein